MGRMKATNPEPTGTKQVKPSTLFKPGQSGNPAGRPKGSKNKLTENILEDLAEFYATEGKDLIRRVRDENPTALLQGLMKLIPRDYQLNLTADISADITAEQRRRIAESWILSQGNAPDILEGEAVRVIEQEPAAALPRPDCDQDDDDDLDRIVPERQQEPVKMKQDDDLFDRESSRQYQPRPGRRAKIISTGARRND